MVDIVKNQDHGDGAHPLDQLGAEFAGAAPLGQGVTDADVAERARIEAAQAEAGVLLKAIDAGAARLVLGLLKAVRARIAKSLPEIADEWTDEVLQGPADASLPVLRKYAGWLMSTLGEHEEIAALAFSLLPLATGYMAAVDKHQAKNVEASPGE